MTNNELIEKLKALKTPTSQSVGMVRTYKSIQDNANLTERNKILDRAIKALEKL